MILTDEQYAGLRQTLFDRTLVGTPKQKQVANDLLIYFNLWFVNSRDTAKISEEIAKDSARWQKKDDFNPRMSTKGQRLLCGEVETLRKVNDLLESLVAEIGKRDKVTK